MTQKRFIINIEDECIDDAKEEIFIDFNDTIDFYNLCKFLNKLVDGNEQLKHDATTLIYANQEYRHENEQLKQEKELLIKALQESSRNTVDFFLKEDLE